jgi:hypothetical protein
MWRKGSERVALVDGGGPTFEKQGQTKGGIASYLSKINGYLPKAFFYFLEQIMMKKREGRRKEGE